MSSDIYYNTHLSRVLFRKAKGNENKFLALNPDPRILLTAELIVSYSKAFNKKSSKTTNKPKFPEMNADHPKPIFLVL